MAELDRLVHEPGRLAILTVLSSVADADFLLPRQHERAAELRASQRVDQPDDAAVVERAALASRHGRAPPRRFVRKTPLTTVEISELGRERTARHWEQLEQLKQAAQAVSASQASQSARRSPAPSRVRPA